MTKEKIYAYIIAYKQANDGLSPSYRDIMMTQGLSSTSVVARYLRKLETDGKITVVGRGIKVTGGEWRMT